jgi:hypothetical protein
MNNTVKNEAWFVQTIPWKGCPFKIQLIVLTSRGQEEAIEIFRKFYNLVEDVEIEICIETPILKGTILEDNENIPVNKRIN